MKFFLRVIYEWLKEHGYCFALYGADGQPVIHLSAGNLPNEFIPQEENGYSYPFPYWICYPIHVDGEYCGCWCFLDADCYTRDNFARVVKMTEIACDLDENS